MTSLCLNISVSRQMGPPRFHWTMAIKMQIMLIIFNKPLKGDHQSEAVESTSALLSDDTTEEKHLLKPMIKQNNGIFENSKWDQTLKMTDIWK